MEQQLNIVFAGTPEFSRYSLEALLASGYQISAVYTQPDRPAGRGRQLAFSPVKQCALEHELPVRQPGNFRDPKDLQRLEELHADLMVVVAYGLILPPRVLNASRLGCVNVHASLLPRWRGAAPIQRAIEAGEQESGVTIMQMSEGLDDGPILLQRRCVIDTRETGGSLHDKLARLGAEALMVALPRIASGGMRGQPQDDTLSCYARKLGKGEGRIDWSRPAVELDRKVRAFNPWPVAYTELQGQPLRIWESSVVAGESGAPPGTVTEATPAGIDVATGEGGLRIHVLQMPGKRALLAGDFLNARQLRGVRFEW
ncbi:MAG: methionyl-tRNA formyltransferase [Gammaproteobacteria bacterium]|nr:methionyl-tRNA formyltransferase [Gammaproteobacteria bacterium]